MEGDNISQEVFLENLNKTVSYLTNGKIKDLSELTDEEDFNLEDAFNSIKPALSKWKKEYKKEKIGEGLRKGASKAEKVLAEVFNEVEFDGDLDDRAIAIRDYYKEKIKGKKGSTKKGISLEDALNSQEVQKYIADLKTKAEQTEKLKNQFESYKHTQSLKQKAIEYYTSNGYKFDSNPKVRELQIRAIEEDLSGIKTNEGYILDEEGGKKFDDELNDHLTFDKYLDRISPLAKTEDEPKSKRTKVTTPAGNGAPSNNFGFGKNHQFTYKDWQAAKQENNAQKASFIKARIAEQADLGE